MNVKEIIISPVLTEKGTNSTKNRVYMFDVNLKANKLQIKDTIEKIYKVKVDKVRVMIRKGKNKRSGRKMLTKKMSNKKTILHK